MSFAIVTLGRQMPPPTSVPPTAPAIGLATAGNSTATIAFTPDPNNGGSPVTAYTATVTPGGQTASGVASPLTITGLTNGTPYTIKVTATSAVGTSLPSGASNSVTPTGAGAPNAPTEFFVTLQGQTVQNASTFNPSPPPSFNIPNEGSIYFGWPDSAAGAFAINHYEMQHTTDLSGATGWTTPTGGGAISTAAPDAQGTRFKDLQCSNSVGSLYGPTAGQYLPATVYLHRLRAVDSQGTPSAWVTGANQYIFNGLTGGASVVGPSGPSGSAGGGFKWTGDLSSAYGINYATVDGTYGFVLTLDMSVATGGYWLPTSGCNYCTYNQQVGSCDFIYFLLKTTNTAFNISMHGEVVGDLAMLPGGAPPGNLNGGTNLALSKYVVGGTVLANTYQLYIVPFTDFMVPQAGAWPSPRDPAAIGVRQLSLYKFLWQANAGCIVTVAKIWVGK